MLIIILIPMFVAAIFIARHLIKQSEKQDHPPAPTRIPVPPMPTPDPQKCLAFTIKNLTQDPIDIFYLNCWGNNSVVHIEGDASVSVCAIPHTIQIGEFIDIIKEGECGL